MSLPAQYSSVVSCSFQSNIQTLHYSLRMPFTSWHLFTFLVSPITFAPPSSVLAKLTYLSLLPEAMLTSLNVLIHVLFANCNVPFSHLANSPDFWRFNTRTPPSKIIFNFVYIWPTICTYIKYMCSFALHHPLLNIFVIALKTFIITTLYSEFMVVGIL